MKFMNEQGEIVEGIAISASKVEALDFLKTGLKNEKYEHLGIMFIESAKIDAILKFVTKNFNIKLLPSSDIDSFESPEDEVPF